MRNIWIIAVLSVWMGPLVVAKEVMIVAHRGASGEAPENTIPAFELAWKQGADAIEGDFFLTKDGHVVCLHDGNTKKLAGKNLVVKDSTLAQLRKLDVGSRKGAAFRGTRIPTIQEVFKTIPAGKKIYVEIKCGVEILPALFREIGHSKLKKEQIVFICFDTKVIQAVKKRAPQFKAYWLCGLKRSRGGVVTPSLAKVLTTLRQIKANGLSSSRDGIDGNFITGLQRGGFEHHVWTVNDAKTAQWFAKRGTRSITTDYPGKIGRSLKGAAKD